MKRELIIEIEIEEIESNIVFYTNSDDIEGEEKEKLLKCLKDKLRRKRQELLLGQKSLF